MTHKDVNSKFIPNQIKDAANSKRNKNKEPVYQETLAKMLATKNTFGLPKEKGQILIFEGRVKKADYFFSFNQCLYLTYQK